MKKITVYIKNNLTAALLVFFWLMLSVTRFSAPAYAMPSFGSSASFWGVLQNHLTLNRHVNTPAVQAAIHELLQDPAKFMRILNAATPYIYYIHERAEANNLPDELALIPVIESEFSPGDRTSVGARGLWQLMPQTARDMGMKVKSGYDARLNVVQSTDGALAFFKDLGVLYHQDWYLAMAAYNSGAGSVNKAIKRAHSNDYFDLKSLPTETKEYVPKLLAVAEIVAHPAKYGVTLPDISNKPYFQTVELKKPVSLNTVSKKTGVDMGTLKTLNPDYRGTVLPDKTHAYKLLVPVAKVASVKSALQSNLS